MAVSNSYRLKSADFRTTTSGLADILAILKMIDVDGIIRECGADRRLKGFTPWAHMVSMVYGMVSGAFSLREIEHGMTSFMGDLQHLGVPKAPARSTIAYANKTRSPEMFEKTFYRLFGFVKGRMDRARNSGGKARTALERFMEHNRVYAFDGTIVSLPLSLFDFAKYKSTKGATKVSAAIELQDHLPCFAVVHGGGTADTKAIRHLDAQGILQRGAFLIIDKGYIDFDHFDYWIGKGVNFVTRAKGNMAYRVVENRPVPRPVGRPPISTGRGRKVEFKGRVRSDQTIELTGRESSRKCPHPLRLVTYYDAVGKRTFTFLTNNFRLSAQTVADLYKARWFVESFFKDLKQNLKFKSFYGTSQNAVIIQVWVSLIAMPLLRYIQFMSETGMGLADVIVQTRLHLHCHYDLIRLLKHLDGVQPPPPEGPFTSSLFDWRQRQQE